MNVDIEKMGAWEWFWYREDQIAEIEKTGKKLVPNIECSTCDPENDYVCFACECDFIEGNQK
mgnify:CR=1 FL=1